MSSPRNARYRIGILALFALLISLFLSPHGIQVPTAEALKGCAACDYYNNCYYDDAWGWGEGCKWREPWHECYVYGTCIPI